MELYGVLLSSDSSGQLHVPNHDSDSLSVDGAKIGIFEETDEIGLGGFLESKDGLGLESNVVLDLSSEILHNSLERKLPDEEVGLFYHKLTVF